MFDLLYQVVFPSLITSIGWGASPYFDKKALKLIDNKYEHIFIIKLLFGGIFSFLIYLFAQKRFELDLSKKNNQKAILYILLTTIVSSFIAQYFYYSALSKTKYTTLVVLITYVVPLVIITLLSNFFLKEKMNFGMIVGLVLCIIGVSIFVYHSN